MIKKKKTTSLNKLVQPFRVPTRRLPLNDENAIESKASTVENASKVIVEEVGQSDGQTKKRAYEASPNGPNSLKIRSVRLKPEETPVKQHVVQEMSSQLEQMSISAFHPTTTQPTPSKSVNLSLDILGQSPQYSTPISKLPHSNLAHHNFKASTISTNHQPLQITSPAILPTDLQVDLPTDLPTDLPLPTDFQLSELPVDTILSQSAEILPLWEGEPRFSPEIDAFDASVESLSRIIPSFIPSIEQDIGPSTMEQFANGSIFDELDFSMPKQISSTPDDLQQELMLSNPAFGFPDSIVPAYRSKGLHQMYEWQREALLSPGVLNGQTNLLYSAPTSAGKTLVAELICLKRVLETKKKALIILPYVAIVSEKTNAMKELFRGINIAGYYSSASHDFSNVDIGICTIEKANSLVNHLLEEGRLDQLTCVVVDELHMIGDPNRGYLLELLLTKIRYTNSSIQCIGMSATLPNMDLLANWLNAHLYMTDYRPVPLTEHVVIGNKVYGPDMTEPLRDLPGGNSKDPEGIVALTWEPLERGASCLIFCPKRDGCSNLAKLLAKELPMLPEEEGWKTQRLQLLTELGRCPGGLDLILEMTIPRGVAYHHSGLTVEERELVEAAYRVGIIKVICATSTLASGVNLPAQRVIIRKPYLGTNFLDPSSYKQMRGRAGRKGLDNFGESFLMCLASERKRVKGLVTAPMAPVSSCLTLAGKGMKRALLEVISVGLVKTHDDLRRYVQNTLLFAQPGMEVQAWSTTADSLQFLSRRAFIEVVLSNPMVKPTQDVIMREYNYELDGQGKLMVNDVLVLQATYTPTRLGQATTVSSLSPEEALGEYDELRAALKNFVLSEETHAIYHVTPIYSLPNPDWTVYENLWGTLSEGKRHVGEVIVGDVERTLSLLASGKKSVDSFRRDGKGHVIQRLIRLYGAFILEDLVNEKSMQHICFKFGIGRGEVQQLQNQSSTFAGMVTIFCQRLGWNSLYLLLQQYQDRLNFGVALELMELVKVNHVKAYRARLFYSAGLKTVANLACSDASTLFEIMWRARPFRSKSQDYDEEYQKKLEQKAAQAIVKSARELMELESKELFMGAKRIGRVLEGVTQQPIVKRMTTVELSLAAKIDPTQTTTMNKVQNVPPIQEILDEPEQSPFDEPLELEIQGNLPPLILTQYATQASKEMFCPSPSQLSLNDFPLFDVDISRLPLQAHVVDVTESFHVFNHFVREWSEAMCFVFSFLSNQEGVCGLLVSFNPSFVMWLRVDSPHWNWSKIKGVFEKKDSFKVAYDLKSQVKMMVRNGADMDGWMVDPKVLSWLIEPEAEERNLDKLMTSHLPNVTLHRGGMAEGALDVLRTWWLTSHLSKFVSKANLWHHALTVEVPVWIVLARMEEVGIGVNMTEFHEYWKMFEDRLAEVERRCYQIVGRTFSLTNPQEVARVLFERLGLPSISKTKSTSKEVLMELVQRGHEIPGLILEHRRLSSLLAKHLVPLQHHQVFHAALQMPRIHTSFGLNTSTGRVCSSNPNLQNIPYPIGESGVEAVNLRLALKGGEGTMVMSADYMQLELRLIAHMSQDGLLLQTLSDPTKDIFKCLAVNWLKIPTIHQVTSEQRKQVKVIVYGVAYGLGPGNLAKELGCTMEEAVVYIKEFKSTYSGFSNFVERVVQTCRQTGYVETILGRRRHLPHINSKNPMEKAKAQRQAVNTTVQGSAADLVKRAMISINAKLRERYGTWWEGSSKIDAKTVPHLVLQIHDELLFEVPKNCVDEMARIVRECMTTALPLSVPTPIGIRIGDSWGNLREYPR